VGAIIYDARAFYTVGGSLQVVGFLGIDDHFFSSLIFSGLIVSAAIDVLIAIALTFLLLRRRSTTGFASTAHILQRLTMFAVNTGLWTALFAVLSAIFVCIAQH